MNDEVLSERTKPVIGLVGGIASGKSHIAKLFVELGCSVIDADAIAKAQFQHDDVKAELTAWLGDQVIDTNGNVDRAYLASQVFADQDSETSLRKLESIIHPRVHAERQRQRRAMGQDEKVIAIIEDCPLLLESGLQASCDTVVFIDVDEAERLRRVKTTRGWDENELSRREARQLPLDEKRKRCDVVIDNQTQPELVREAVSTILKHSRSDFAKTM